MAVSYEDSVNLVLSLTLSVPLFHVLSLPLTHTHIGCQYCMQLSQPTLSEVTGCLTLGLGWQIEASGGNTHA